MEPAEYMSKMQFCLFYSLSYLLDELHQANKPPALWPNTLVSPLIMLYCFSEAGGVDSKSEAFSCEKAPFSGARFTKTQGIPPPYKVLLCCSGTRG